MIMPRPYEIRKRKGFTLVELMVAMTIIAILAAIAYPSYLNQVRASRRAVAKSALLDMANRQEQYFFNNKKYAEDLTLLGYASAVLDFDDNHVPTDHKADAVYRISVAAMDDAEACGAVPCFQLQAAPRNDQINDGCGAFILASDNGRTVNNTTGKPAGDCW